jgi:hypothetical protein
MTNKLGAYEAVFRGNSMATETRETIIENIPINLSKSQCARRKNRNSRRLGAAFSSTRSSGMLSN